MYSMWILDTKFVDLNFNSVSFLRYNISKALVEREVLVKIIAGLVTIFITSFFYTKGVLEKALLSLVHIHLPIMISKNTTLPSEASFVIVKIKKV